MILVRNHERRNSEVSERKSKKKRRNVRDCLDKCVPKHVSDFEVQIQRTRRSMAILPASQIIPAGPACNNTSKNIYLKKKLSPLP